MKINEKNGQSGDLDLACIPSNYSRLVARELGLHAHEVARLLQLTGLSRDQLLQEDRLLTPRQQIQILQNSIDISGDDMLGLRLGRRFTSPTHGAMGFLVNSSPDLLTALQAFQAFLPTRMNLARLNIVNDQDWLRVYCAFDMALPDHLLRVMSEIFALIFFDSAAFIVDQSLAEVRIQFAHTEPSYSERYAEYMPGHFEFSQPQIVAHIPMAVCRIPNASANHENYLIALQQCQGMLAQLQANRHSSKYQIQKMMLSHPPGMLSEEEAAAALFISKRTLARRLRKEGCSFRTIRDEILSQQAASYLRDSDMSVEAIAALLNYHDSSNFRRAFKRWFKMAPDQFRNQARL